MTEKIIIDYEKIDKELAGKACYDVIDILSKYPISYKIYALKTLIETFPEEYIIIEKKRENNEQNKKI